MIKDRTIIALRHTKPGSPSRGTGQICFAGNCILKFILLDICLLYFPKAISQSNTTVWADSCSSNSFYGKMISPGYSDFSQVHEYPGRGIILVGTSKDNFAQLAISRNYGHIMRLTPEGDSVWSKFIGITDPAIQVDLRMYASVVTSNGDIIVVSAVNAGSLGGNFVLRINGAGVIAWQKRLPYFDPSFPSEVFTDIIETSDDGFLITGSRPNEGILLKIDKDGNYVWRNRLIGSDFMPDINAVAEGNAAYYVSGQGIVSATGYSGNYIARADKLTGDIQFIKWINISGSTPLTGATEYEFDKMNFKEGIIALTGTTSLYYTGPDRNAQIAVYLNENGDIISAARIENLDKEIAPANAFQGALFDPFTKTGVQSGLSGGNEYYVYRLKSDLTSRWAWKIPLTDAHAAMDSKVFHDSSFILAGLGRDANNIVSADVLKTSGSGKLENCVNQPFPFIVSTQQASSQYVPNMYESPGNSTVQLSTSNLDEINGAGFNWQLQCSNKDVCRISKITGSKTVCKGSTNLFSVARNGNCRDSVFFSSDAAGTIINNSDSSANISFSAEGNFVLHARMQAECGVLQDSIIVQVKNSGYTFSLGADTSLCLNNKIRLKASGGFETYLWQDGSADSVYTVTEPGTYHVTVKDACGKIFSDTILVNAAPFFQFSVGPDRIKCNKDTLHINGPTGFVHYNWSPDYNIISEDASGIIINPYIDTDYTVSAEKYPGCLAYDTIKVQVINSPEISLGADKEICSGDTLLLNAGPGFESYLWSNGSNAQTIIAEEPGIYSVTGIAANGCRSSDTIMLSDKSCFTDFYVPSAFTPNKDGLNDIFKPVFSKQTVQYHFEIFNRWGQKIFETNDATKGWDGNVNGKGSNSNVFVWLCVYQFEGNRKEVKRGTFLLMK